MPDRKLTNIELQQFKREDKSGRLEIRALAIFREEKTEPSLHDLCIHELDGKLSALIQIIIKQAVEIQALKERS